MPLVDESVGPCAGGVKSFSEMCTTSLSDSKPANGLLMLISGIELVALKPFVPTLHACSILQAHTCAYWYVRVVHTLQTVLTLPQYGDQLQRL